MKCWQAVQVWIQDNCIQRHFVRPFELALGHIAGLRSTISLSRADECHEDTNEQIPSLRLKASTFLARRMLVATKDVSPL